MTDWENALDVFIAEWKDEDEVLGALLTGSYAVGNETKFSDIDVHIVLADTVDWRERGNQVVNGYLIEYFANPERQLRKYLEDDYKDNSRTDARMFSIGRVLFDKDGTVATLQADARAMMSKPFQKQSEVATEVAKYLIWDQLDNLAALHDQDSPNFAHAYHRCLSKIFVAYANHLQVEMIAPDKAYKFFTDAEFRMRYHIDRFPDDAFVKRAVDCLITPSFSNIEGLAGYVFERMGGFNIDGWKIRTPVEV